MTLRQQVQYEFDLLYNVSDLLPFFKIKSFWNKINLHFFVPIYQTLTEFTQVVKVTTVQWIMKYVQGLFPV